MKTEPLKESFRDVIRGMERKLVAEGHDPEKVRVALDGLMRDVAARIVNPATR